MDYKAIIESKGMKYGFIAEKIGVSKPFLSMCLNRKKKLPEKRKIMLHNLLNINN